MKKIVAFCLFFFCIIAYAQDSIIIESTIIEAESSASVEKAKVKIEETDLVTYTNEKGFFSFKGNIDEGSYLVSISKDGYVREYFELTYDKGKKATLEIIKIKITKDEAKRRKNEEKLRKKELAEKIKKIEKENKEKEKELKKARKRLSKKNSVDIVYDETPVVETVTISESQKKYAEILGVDVLLLSNKEMYEFINKWEGTPYEWGSSYKDAIDCSAFTQRLLNNAKGGMLIERTAQKQFDSKYSDKFTSREHLKEGDLIFFGKDKYEVTHVGVYLHNNKFVHATSRTVDGPAGVKISDLTHPFWSKLFVSAGRRINNE